MDSLVTLAIILSIGLFIEPGWRLHPEARSKIAYEREHHHHEEHKEDSGPAAAAEEEPQEANGPPGGFAGHGLGRLAFENLNERVGAAAIAGKAQFGALAAPALALLRGPMGITATAPSVLLAVGAALWVLDRAFREPQLPITPPTSPLAPKLGLDEARDFGEPVSVWPTSTIFLVGLAIGLGASMVLAGRAAKPEKEPTPAPAQLRPPETKATKWVPARAEELEKGEKGKRSRKPEEYTLWTPQTSWTAASSQVAEGDERASRVSWGETLTIDAAAVAA